MANSRKEIEAARWVAAMDQPQFHRNRSQIAGAARALKDLAPHSVHVLGGGGHAKPSYDTREAPTSSGDVRAMC